MDTDSSMRVMLFTLLLSDLKRLILSGRDGEAVEKIESYLKRLEEIESKDAAPVDHTTEG